MTPPTSIDGTDISGATIDGQEVQEITVDGQTVFTATPPGAFDIRNAQFDFKANTITTNDLTSLAMSPDGTKFYVGTLTSTKQFTLSTPYDLRSYGQYVQRQVSEHLENRAIEFSTDGTRFYNFERNEGGRNNPRVFQYNLSTPFELEDLDSPTKNFEPPDTVIKGGTFSRDGSKMYTADEGNNKVRQFNLSTPFEIDTASLEKTDDTLTDFPEAIKFSDDGSAMFLLDGKVDGPKQFKLSTPFDIGTATFDAELRAKGGGTTFFNPDALEFSREGTRMYVGESDTILQFTVEE